MCYNMGVKKFSICALVLIIASAVSFAFAECGYLFHTKGSFGANGFTNYEDEIIIRAASQCHSVANVKAKEFYGDEWQADPNAMAFYQGYSSALMTKKINTVYAEYYSMGVLGINKVNAQIGRTQGVKYAHLSDELLALQILFNVCLGQYYKQSQEPTDENGAGILSNLPNGLKLRSTGTGAIYTMAGGAPIYVSNWANIGGYKNDFLNVTTDFIDETLPLYPRDGTYVRGYLESDTYFVFAGGAPLYVPNWDAGDKSYAIVDHVSLKTYESISDPKSYYYRHVRQYPLNGTVLQTENGDYWIVAGGKPFRVYDTANILPITNCVPASLQTVEAAGSFDENMGNLRPVPLDFTYLVVIFADAEIFAPCYYRNGLLKYMMLFRMSQLDTFLSAVPEFTIIDIAAVL